MIVVYAKESPPESFEKAIFLAGPTPRSSKVASWRPAAVQQLANAGYEGIVFLPEERSGKRFGDYIDQVEWEERCLHMADCILFWIPRDMNTMPALTTNTEWGVWQDSGKAVFGAPRDAQHVRYQEYYSKKFGVPCASTLPDAVAAAIELVGEGALRTGGEREVPLYIWRTSHFQQWYAAQRSAGNRLDGARVEWTFRIGPQRKLVFFWVLHVDVYIASEDRHKTNEVVIARPDIATVVMYRRGGSLDDADVILIREFRSPAATSDGFVWEVPGGSSLKPKGDPLQLAADECYEETGLRIPAERMKRHESRQLNATLSAHRAHLFSVEITGEELENLRSQFGVAHGVVEDTERTYVEVMKLGDIRGSSKVDWSTLGMIMQVVS